LSEALPERVRVRFTKQGKVRFTSHRDVARMFERALRRSALPVAWSEGFSPRPLLSFGLALPTGCESLAEYLDVKLEAGAPAAGPEGDPVALDDLPGLLTPLLPEGVAVVAAGPVPVGAGSLQQEVTSCTWELEVFGVSPEELAIYVERLLDAPSLLIRRERKGREVEDDLRPSVRHLTVVEGPVDLPSTGDPRSGLVAELATQPRGVRPTELVEGLGADLVLARACRTQQWIERDGARWEPLPSGREEPGALPPHAQERAS